MRIRPGMAMAGIAALALLQGCGGGGGSTAPPPPAISVTVSPAQAKVKVSSQFPFQAVVSGSVNGAVTWQVNGTTGGSAALGTIDVNGIYTAPATVPAPASVTVTAVAAADSSKSGSSSVTITIGVSVLPAIVSLNLNTPECPVSQQFAAMVTGSGNSSVSWSVNGLAAGDPNTIFGTITSGGLYVPPAEIPTPPGFNVTATSQLDPTQSASASVTVAAGGPSVDQAPQTTPIELGTSGGNAGDSSGGSCCSGTLGALVQRNGSQFILSNNHVLGRTNQAQPGESIVQPGLVDTHCAPSTNAVATFTQAVRLQSGAPADAALAKVIPGQVDPTGAILQLGPVSCGLAQPMPPASTTVTPAVGMAVAKSGRSTGLTCGTISQVAVDVQVLYPNSCGSTSGFVVSFSNQVVIQSPSFSSAGDSGSLIVTTGTAEATALLFGGDSTTGVTIANPIQDVLASLPDPNNQALPTMIGGSTHTVAACAGSTGSSVGHLIPPAWPSPAAVAHAKAVKSNYSAALRADPAVIGVGVGAGENAGQAAIVVFVERGKDHQAIPATLDGVPVEVKIIGPLLAFGEKCGRKSPADSEIDRAFW